MDYYGALPSYFKGLEKCPVGGLKNVTEDDGFFFLTANAKEKCTACLFIKVHNVSNRKSLALKKQTKTVTFSWKNHPHRSHQQLNIWQQT